MKDETQTAEGQETGTQIDVMRSADLKAKFKIEGGISGLVDLIKDECGKHALEVETEEGRAFIRSLAYSVAQSKALIDKTGKDITEGWRTQTAQINAIKKKAIGDLTQIQANIREPLTRWEEAEKGRISKHEDNMRSLEVGHLSSDSGLEELGAAKDRIGGTVIDESWEEYEGAAGRVQEKSIDKLDTWIATVAKREADARELGELRALKAEREAEAQKQVEAAEQAERDAKAKAEAEAQAKADAEAAQAKAKADAEAAEQRAKDAEAEAEAAKVKAKADAEAADARAKQLAKEAAEQAEQDAARREAEAAAKAKAEAVEAEAQKERDRLQRIADQDARVGLEKRLTEALKPKFDEGLDALVQACLDGEIEMLKVIV